MPKDFSEGDPCPLGCGNVLETATNGLCYCSVTPHPPCWACENSILRCMRCGHNPYEEDGDAPTS